MLPDGEDTSTYIAWRMLPPGKHKYFYSVANVPKVAVDQPSAENDSTEPPPKEFKVLKDIPERKVIDIDKTYFSKPAKTRDAIAGSAPKPGKNSVLDSIKKAKMKAQLDKWDEEEPNYLEVDIPFTNVIENLKQTVSSYDKKTLESQKAVPRPPPKELAGRDKLKTPWKMN